MSSLSSTTPLLLRWPLCAAAGLLSLISVMSCVPYDDADEPVDPGPRHLNREFQLSNLPGALVAVVVSENDEFPARGASLHVRIGYRGASPQGLGEGTERYCPRLAGLALGFDGRPFDFPGKGGWLAPSPGIKEYMCVQPSALLDFPGPVRKSGIDLVISDPSVALTVPLGDSLLARSASLQNPPASAYRQGDIITVQWSPATDVASQLPTVAFEDASGGIAEVMVGAAVTRGAGTLSFPVSAKTANLGAGRLRVTLGSDLRLCEGRCQFHVVHHLTLPVTIQTPR